MSVKGVKAVEGVEAGGLELPAQMFWSLLYGTLVYFILFSAYLELSPRLTNIWYRISSDGVRRINLSSYFHFLSRPFYTLEFWYPRNWDLNYFVGAFLCALLFYLFM